MTMTMNDIQSEIEYHQLALEAIDQELETLEMFSPEYEELMEVYSQHSWAIYDLELKAREIL